MPLKHDGTAYRGINIISLWGAAAAKGYSNPRWMSFNQAKKLGGIVRKGEKGSPIYFYSSCYKKETDFETGEEVITEISDRHYLKLYWVFNVEQIDNLSKEYYSSPVISPQPDALLSKAVVKHGGNSAYYNRQNDYIQMPLKDSFLGDDYYFSTLAHELTHWSGAESRLNRVKSKKFGDSDYAFEELVAEIGSCFLCSQLGIPLTERLDED